MADANDTVTTADQLTPSPINELPAYPALSTTSDLPPTTAAPAPQATAAPSPEAEPEAEAAAAEPTEKPKRGRPSKAEIELAELREQNKLILERLAALSAPTAPEVKAAPEPEPVKLARPRRAEYDDPDEYEDALYEYREAVREQKESAAAAGRQAKETEAQAAARQAKAQEDSNAAMSTEWAAKVTAAKERYEDFEAIAFSATTPITVPMGHAILNSEYGADIAYWLGENVEEARRISAIANPVRQALEIGRIEAAFVKAEAAEEKPAPKPAPAVARPAPGPRPIRPVTPRSQPVDEAPSPQNSEARIEAMLKEMRSGNSALGWGPASGRA